MKLKTNILFSLLLCGTFATAQNLKLDILPPSVTLGQDSAIVSMKRTFNVPQRDTKSHSRLTPVLTDGTHTAELPQILLNGERAHRLYRRTLALNKRRGKADVTPVFTAIPLTDSDQTIHYRASLPAADWIQFATLNLKKEVINGSGEKVQSENIPIPDTAPHIATATDHFVPQRDRNREAPMAAASPSAPVVPEHHSVSPAPSAPSAKPYFKGSYVSPESVTRALHRSHQLQEHSGTVLQNHRHQCQVISGKPRCQPQRRCRRHRTGQHTGSRPLSANGFP